MLTHLFTYLPTGDPVYRVNLASAASAAYAALAVVAVYAAALLLSRQVVSAAALAFGPGAVSTAKRGAVCTLDQDGVNPSSPYEADLLLRTL